jgi:hypothetical protein
LMAAKKLAGNDLATMKNGALHGYSGELGLPVHRDHDLGACRNGKQ